MLHLPQHRTGPVQDGGRDQGGRVVRAEHPAAALQRVLAQRAGLPPLGPADQGKAEAARGGQGVGMVGAEDGPPAVKHLFADGPAAAAVAVGVQIVGGVQDQLSAGGRGVDQRASGEHVRSELGIAGPAGRVLRVAGGCGGQQRHRLVGDGLLAVGRKLLADDRLYQPVHLEAVGVAAGQRVADQRAEGVGEGVGVGGGGAQRLVEQVRRGRGSATAEWVRGRGRRPAPAAARRPGRRRGAAPATAPRRCRSARDSRPRRRG